MKGFHFLCAILAVIVLTICPALGYAATDAPVVMTASMDGVVGVVLENHLQEVFEEANDIDASLVVLEIDTPGGLVSSTRAMTAAILDAPFPVCFWVTPPGGRAASAGSFLVEASHVAAMAPGATIGAAHPVSAGGGDVPQEEMSKKITSDLAAHMRSLAEQRGRDPENCSLMVTDSLSYTSREALEKNVVDIEAKDLDSLLAQIEGKTVEVSGADVRLSLEGAEVRRFEMNPRLKLLQFVSRPDVAYLLLVAGVYAVIFEILSPGGFVMGVSGGIMVLLGALGLRMLPFNWAGVVLLLAGAAVMVLDLVVGGIGVLSLFGAAALFIGGIILFRAPGGELLNVSYGFMTGVALVLTLFFLAASGAVWRSLRGKPVSGEEGLEGSSAIAETELDPEGTVFCHGELWRAVLESGGKAHKGTRVKVVEVRDLTLVVTPCDKKACTTVDEEVDR